MKACKLLSFAIFFLMYACVSYAQPPTKIVVGQIRINDGTLYPNQNKYIGLTDSLNKRLKANPNDTSSLFYRALLYSRFNDIMAKPAPGEPATFENLVTAKNMVEKAVSLKMSDIRLKVLRAQIYSQLCFQYSGDESWKFNTKQIALRKAQFNTYKGLANKYYDEVATLDSINSYDYQKLKVTTNYPL